MRKDDALAIAAETRRNLQWSRIQVDAEGWPRRRLPVALVGLQWSRIQVDAEGRSVGELNRHGHAVSSMEPHPSRCGRKRRGTGDTFPGGSSMEPHPSRCGRDALRAKVAELEAELLQWSRIQVDAEGRITATSEPTPSPCLQWSRIQVDAEGTPLGCFHGPRIMSSMEPHPSRCGRSRSRAWGQRRRGLSSMEPHPSRCGRVAQRDREAVRSGFFNGAASK